MPAIVLEFVVGADVDPVTWSAALPPKVLVAIDDADAGYDSLALVDALRPSFMKIDRTTVPGVEYEGERSALVDAGVHLGQGYLLGRPRAVAGSGETAARATS